MFSVRRIDPIAWAAIVVGQTLVGPVVAGETPVVVEKSVELFPGFDRYHRKVTTSSPAAQALFDQGLQLLYGFNHDEAIRSFQRAAEIDPDCAMAHWGVGYASGMHINNPLMTPEQTATAHAAAQRAIAALDDETPVEQALIRALATRYVLPAPEDRTSLDAAYADAMEPVWHAFPDDPDVAALYAESLMDTQPWDLWTADGEPKGRTLEIVAVLERLLRLHPDHPGGNHFYIHAIEASPWPERGTPAAERLIARVPGSGHLVHMPSHIFIRTGRYAEAAQANERAIAADQKYFAAAPPPQFYTVYFLHNLHFLAYSSMMEGRFESALAAARQVESNVPEDFLREFVFIADGFMPTTLHVLLRFGKWEDILAEPEPQEWRLFSRAEWHYARAVALANLKQTDEARDELTKLDAVAEQLTDEWLVGNNQAADVIAVSRLMAEGELEYHSGRPEHAFDLLRQAVAAEELLSYDEPPGWMQPVRHALGALLLAEERHAEAEEVYRADLQRHPHNAWSLLGLQQALEAQENAMAAAELAEEVDQAWARADVKPAASCYCHPDAGGQD
ncbi:MAG: hypothetical protein KDA44_18565 [Planctomycetales bacterium]|nr:hypothetical protein [Planctomycetales bacterium]